MSTKPVIAPDPEPPSTPRRQVLRSLFGAVVGVAAMIALAACGGEGDEGDEGDEEEEEEDD